MNNHGNYIVSLGNVCRWLATQAEALGVEIYPGFAAAEVLYNEDGSVKGVVTGDMGIGKDGEHKDNYTAGHGAARQVHADRRGRARLAGQDAVRQVRPARRRRSAEVRHRHQGAVAGPTDAASSRAWSCTRRAGRCRRPAPGGSFMYHFGDNLRGHRLRGASQLQEPLPLAVRRVPALQDTIPTSPSTSKGGKRIVYGARAITEGGLQSVPKLTFPGGALIGCSAGFVNVPRIKGSHNAMKTGMLARRGRVRGAGRGQDRRRRADRLSGGAARRRGSGRTSTRCAT